MPPVPTLNFKLYVKIAVLIGTFKNKFSNFCFKNIVVMTISQLLPTSLPSCIKSQEMPAVIRCRIVYLPGCYPKI